jgi:hypothetical protein
MFSPELTIGPMEFTIPAIICVSLLAYLCLVRSLRWRRYNAIHERYRAKYETETLTPEEAQKIIHVGAFYDMPSLVKYSLAFALFKAAAIVSWQLCYSLRVTDERVLYFEAFHIKTPRRDQAAQDKWVHLQTLC